MIYKKKQHQINVLLNSIETSIFLTIIISTLSLHTLFSQQTPDTLYCPIIKQKTYKHAHGTIVHIDRGHRNFHTRTNRFLPFSNLLEKDGYQVVDYNGKFESDSLKHVAILVISNALHENARQPFVAPTKSAFTEEEIKVLSLWVEKGGSLFLIADHMPFAGASAALAKEFGFEFYDGFAFEDEVKGIFDFTLENNMLTENIISIGRYQSEKVSKIRTFTGQGFKIPKKATSILNFKKIHTLFIPERMWVFNEQTIKLPATNLSQGAYMKYGNGRVVVFGEAAMFTCQLAGAERIKVGMNAPEASENYKLLLNIIHWLDELY